MHLSLSAETMLARSSSPADKVTSNGDLLMEILYRLPVRSLLRFKSVSKLWYSLITNPSFKLLRSRIPDPPSGLFVPVRNDKPYLEFEFVPFNSEDAIKSPLTTPNFDPDVNRIDIEHSSSGLMLCIEDKYMPFMLCTEDEYVPPRKYYVYNPTINQFITLPPLENYEKVLRLQMTIAFDPSKSPHYRIICVCYLITGNLSNANNYRVEIFSSTTRTFKPSFQFSYDPGVMLDFKCGVYWNNAIHWLQDGGYVLYFKLDEESVHEILIPTRHLSLDDYWDSLIESRDQLLLVEIHASFTPKFKIHELNRDYSTWCVKYDIDLEEVGRSFPEILNPRRGYRFEFAVLSVVLGEKEDDSFVVLEVLEKALKFNLVSHTFHKLHDFPASRYSKPGRVISRLLDVYQFWESLYTF